MTHLERNRKYRANGGDALKLAHRWQMRCHRARKALLESKKELARLRVLLRKVQGQLDLINNARVGCGCSFLSDRPCERCWARMSGPLEFTKERLRRCRDKALKAVS